MKRFLTMISAVCICVAMTSSAHAAIYGWTISDSDTDPLVQIGTGPNGSTDNVYLWLACSDEGMSASEIDLVSNPGGNILAFNVLNGFLNAGTAQHLLLAVGGCPQAPMLAGAILILHFVPLTVCAVGANVTVDCSANPQAWPHDRKSYSDPGLVPCASDTENLCLVSVEESSWGSIKSLYR